MNNSVTCYKKNFIQCLNNKINEENNKNINTITINQSIEVIEIFIEQKNLVLKELNQDNFCEISYQKYKKSLEIKWKKILIEFKKKKSIIPISNIYHYEQEFKKCLDDLVNKEELRKKKYNRLRTN